MFPLVIAVLFASLHVFPTVLGQYVPVENYPRVLTNHGAIRGYYKFSNNHNIYEAFEGVPYALPPIGERRFEIPEPIEPWSGELVANKLAEPCIAFKKGLYPKGKYVDGNEDCLYMNIYSPMKREGLLPVIVYIHGGGFLEQNVQKDEAHYLIDYDVIYVAMNFRIGILGYLSTGDNVVPGNMGLKDQNLALRWIHDNIIYFGGDPNRVTITGLSTGASSVHLHYLSPLSRGLFQNGISLSGTAFKCWAQTVHAREKAMRIGAALNCPTYDTKSLIKCLKQRSATDLISTTTLFLSWQLLPIAPFAPVIEWPSENAFLSRPPAEIVRSGDFYDVPWITGVLSDEDRSLTANFASNNSILQDLDENWEEIAPILLEYNYTVPVQSHSAIARRIRQHYFGNKPINRENIDILTRLMDDRLFNTDSVRAVMAQAGSSRSPIWFYYYSYAADAPFGRKVHGALHSDDVDLVVKDSKVVLSQRDTAMQKILLKLWTSFAHNGRPDLGVKWSEVNSLPGILTDSNFNFLHMGGPDYLKEEHSVEFAQSSFWKSLGINGNTQGTTDCECN